MTKMERGAEEDGGASAKRASVSQSTLGPTGYGSGPLWAAGMVLGGAMLFAGWGVSQVVFGEPASAAVAGESTPAPSVDPEDEPGTVTVTLEDENGDGVPDVLEQVPGGPIGRGDEEDQDGGTDGDDAPKTQVYVIQPGDTLTEISGMIGVPVGILVDVNKIGNPDLIYAGASLLIPPV